MMSLNVLETDILSLTGYDAIVNSTNTQLKPLLLNGSSLDKKIHSISGKGLEEECKKIREAGGCELCDAVVTDAYQLSYQHIIHVVVPDAKKDGASWREYGQCYYSVLSVAMDNGDKKIALPLLGIKKRGYSEREATEYAVKSVKEFCRAYPEGLEQITFVVKDNPELADYIKKLLTDASRATSNIVSFSFDINNIKFDGLEDFVCKELEGVKEVAAKTIFKPIKKLRCISLLAILSLAEPIWKVLKKPFKWEHIEKRIVIEKDKVTVKLPLCGQEVIIGFRQVALRKQGDRMKLVIDIEKINLDALVDVLAECCFNAESEDKNIQLVNCILKSVNASTEGNKKYELIQCLLDWLNSTNLINDVIHNVAKHEGGKIEELIEAAELEIGNIVLLM